MKEMRSSASPVWRVSVGSGTALCAKVVSALSPNPNPNPKASRIGRVTIDSVVVAVDGVNVERESAPQAKPNPNPNPNPNPHPHPNPTDRPARESTYMSSTVASERRARSSQR